SGEPAARAELVPLIAAAVAANPGFEQQLRNAAAVAQTGVGGVGAPGVGGASAFFKTTNGMLAIVAAVVVVVGGGIGLGVGLGGGSGDLAGVLKGTWTCQIPAAEDAGPIGSSIGFTVGDGTWNAGTSSGTWTQNGSSVTVNDPTNPTYDMKATHLPSGTGSFDISVSLATDSSQQAEIKGTLSDTKLTVRIPTDGGGPVLSLTCTK
ncbi:hypothetical protein KGQ20_28630, partial [Catenulispora sp. NF23]